MKKQRKYQKGITLIALVITIIILLILAGVTINIVINGGIISNSQTAVNKYSEESAREKLSLALFGYKMGVITGEEKTFGDYIAEIGGAIIEEVDDSYTIELDGYEFNVNKNTLEITSLGEVKGEKPSITKSEVTLSEDKLSAIIKVTASATKDGALTVTIGGTTATLEGGTYNLTVTDNGTYTIIVSENGLTRKAIGTVEVSGIEKRKYTVTVSYTGTGIDSVTPTTEQVEEGKSIEIKATVTSGYVFSKWKVTSGNESDVASLTSATTTVTPTGNITIEATAGKQMSKVINGDNTGIDATNGTLNGKPATYQNPVIPAGFKTVNVGTATWSLSEDGNTVTGWDNGLVIDDGTGNQFVWVPVDGTNVTYAKWCITNIAYNDTNITGDKLPSEVTSETTQIETYGGFYIGRYEASQPTSGTVPQTQYDKAPWVSISYTNSKSYAESYQTGSFVKSGLLTGTMWDTALAWIDKSETGYSTSTNKGNYSGTKANTGKTTTDCVKNIYDLAGNVREWTGEKYSADRVGRGGYYNGSNAPAYRSSINVTYSSSLRFPSWAFCTVALNADRI